MCSVNSTAQDGLRWVPAADPQFQICGLPFFHENDGHWWRLPPRAQADIPGSVWIVSKHASGARIRFRSDTTSLAIRYKCDVTAPANKNFSLHGEAGCDLYMDNRYVGTAIPLDSPDVNHVFFGGLTKQMRTICLYLPLYAEVTMQSIGIDTDAKVEPAPEFAVSQPVLFYGTSITQGGCASRPGLSYEAMLCRQLNLDYVNFGFAGSGRGERAVAELVAEVDASCFVLDFSQNSATVEELEGAYLPFIETLREHHPTTPIICITPIYWVAESIMPDWKKRQDEMRSVIRDAVQKRVDAGDKAVSLVDGLSLLGPDQAAGLVDGLHPNTLGFYWMAKGLAPHIASALDIDSAGIQDDISQTP